MIETLINHGKSVYRPEQRSRGCSEPDTSIWKVRKNEILDVYFLFKLKISIFRHYSMSVKNIIDDIKYHNWNASWLDFSVFFYEGNRLTIAGSDDFSYYHNLEIIIENPSYISGVMDWSCDSNEEFIKLSIQNHGSKIVSILEFYADNELRFKVIGGKVSGNFDTVFYYKRDNLKTNERLAYWVK